MSKIKISIPTDRELGYETKLDVYRTAAEALIDTRLQEDISEETCFIDIMEGFEISGRIFQGNGVLAMRGNMRIGDARDFGGVRKINNSRIDINWHIKDGNMHQLDVTFEESDWRKISEKCSRASYIG